jgi:hypothetical protein
MGHASLPFFESCCLIEHRGTVNGSVAALAEQQLALYVDLVRSVGLSGGSRSLPNCLVFNGLWALMREFACPLGLIPSHCGLRPQQWRVTHSPSQ